MFSSLSAWQDCIIILQNSTINCNKLLLGAFLSTPSWKGHISTTWPWKQISSLIGLIYVEPNCWAEWIVGKRCVFMHITYCFCSSSMRFLRETTWKTQFRLKQTHLAQYQLIWVLNKWQQSRNDKKDLRRGVNLIHKYLTLNFRLIRQTRT